MIQKTKTIDKIKTVGDYKHIQVREKTDIGVHIIVNITYQIS